MKVLHVIATVAPRYGGPSTAIAAMAGALNRIPGVTAEVAATDADGPERFDAKNWPVENTRLHLFPRDGSARYFGSTGLASWLKDKAGDYDVIESHGLWNFPVYAARAAARKHRKPLVLRPCGMLSDYTWSRNAALKRAYWWARERGNVSGAAAFHCTSEGEAGEVRRLRAASGMVRVIPNGVDSAAWTTPDNPGELRRRCGPRADGLPIVLFLSRLHPKKGLTDLLLPAFAAMKERAFLAIVGGPDENAPGYPAEIRAAMERLGLRDRTALLGPIAAAERWALFDGAAAFALPSHSENFGIVVAEAMARGCPVLVTDGVQSHEHVSRAGAGVVTKTDSPSVGDGLNRLLGGDRADFGTKGRAYARELFDWDRIAGPLLELYRGLHPRTER